MPETGYNPTEEEIRQAEGIMDDDKRDMSRIREDTLERLKTAPEGSYFWVITRAQEIGIPEEEIKEYFRKIVKNGVRRGEPINMYLSLAYRASRKKAGIMLSANEYLGIGPGIIPEEEIREIAKRTYEQMLKEVPSNFDAAGFLYGENSEEYQRAKELYNKRRKERRKKEQKGRKWRIVSKTNKDREAEGAVILVLDATFFDLFEAIESDEGIEVELDELFWSEVYERVGSHFDEDAQGELEKFFDQPALAKTTKVLEFFEKYGYSKEEVEAFLPIRFK